jgi:hypothetical protein
MSDDPCGAHPADAAALRAARARQFAHHADQAIGVVTDVQETDDGLVVRGILERNTVQFLADPRFGFVAGPSFGFISDAERSYSWTPSRRVRFARWRQRVRKRLAERIGGRDLHEDCY